MVTKSASVLERAGAAPSAGARTIKAYTPRQLHAAARARYAGCPDLSWHQRLVSVHRPLYAPLHLMLPWIRPGSRVVDVGCGTGTLLLLADMLVGLAEGCGYDRHAAAIAIAQRANAAPHLTFTTERGRYLEALDTADTLVCSDLLHHLSAPDQCAVLAELVGAMRPGTRLIIKDLDARPRWRALANRVTDYLSTRSRVHYLSRHDLERSLGAAGLSITVSEPLNRHVWSHYLVVADMPA